MLSDLWFQGKTCVDGDEINGVWFYRNTFNNPVYDVVVNGTYRAWYTSLEAGLHNFAKFKGEPFA